MTEWLVPHNRWVNRPEYEDAALRVLRSGHVASGPEVAAFERELAERFRPGGEAVCVSSGTAALYLALKVSRPEHSILGIPTYACAGIYNAAKMSNAYPNLMDCERGTFMLSTRARNIEWRHVEIHVDIYGLPSDVTDIGAYVVSDVTHSVGGLVNGKPCGSLGQLSVISFGATKPLGVGAGGAVLGPSDAIAEIRDRMDYEKAGDRFNFSFNDVHAAIGRERLKRLESENHWRHNTSVRYCAVLVDHAPSVDVHGVTPFFHRDSFITDSWWGACLNVRPFYRFVLRLRQVDEARARFSAAGIETIVPIRTDELIHRQIGLDPERFPNAEEIARTTLSLPIWPGMSDEQVNRVADVLATLGDLQ